MMFLQSLKMAWESVRSNKMRSFLTMLGVIIGVFSLVVLVSIINGATGTITNAVASFGSGTLTVQVTDGKGKNMTLSDVEALQGRGAIDKTSPSATFTVTVDASGKKKNAEIYAVGDSYQRIMNLELECGRFIKSPDMDNHSMVAIVSPDVVKSIMKLGSPQEAIGKTVSLGGMKFRVIGVTKDKTGAASSLFYTAKFKAYIPWSTAVRISDSVPRFVDEFIVSAKDQNLDTAQEEMGKILSARFNDDKQAFSIFNFNEVTNQMSVVTGVLSLVMGGVAGISLLVGGIGIMNIMLVSVTERTREIGIRKAIGAKRRAILLQFLMESAMISLLGCLIGVGLSWAVLQVVNVAAASFAAQPIHFGLSGGVVLLATTFSIVIGIVFGMYPANKAARMKPIDALRFN